MNKRITLVQKFSLKYLIILFSFLFVLVSCKNDNFPSQMSDSTGSNIPIEGIEIETETIGVSDQIYTYGIGSSIVSDIDGMVMMYVPDGEFLLGTNQNSLKILSERYYSLDAFWIDQTEVTNAMYAKCYESGGCRYLPSLDNKELIESYYYNPKFANYPVINVHSIHAQDYCDWAGRRLPTEAEWEKAARGIDGNIYPWGNQEPDSNLANYGNNIGFVVEVGSFPAGASPYGVLDMAGNVAEWVTDRFQISEYGRDVDFYSVTRGGSWMDSNKDIRTFERQEEHHVTFKNTIGFRCVKDVDQIKNINTDEYKDISEEETKENNNFLDYYLLFSSQDFLSAESDLHSISPDEKSIINLGKGSSDAKWSPDFSKLVTREYINEPGKKYNILVTINSDEANRKELTGSDFNASNPIWTPDGKSIIFSSNDEVFIIDSNGNNLTKLLNNGFVWDISSNGAQFIYSSFNNSKMEDECFIYHMENGLSEKLAYGGQNMSFSRDGNFILFDARTDDNREIFIMNSDGSDLRQLTSKQGDNFCPSFTPDGKKIVFTSMRIDDLMKLFIMDIDGTNQERIPNFDAAPSNLTWAPTGQYFAVQSGLGHIYIMDINGNIENIIQDPVGKGKSVFLADW